ncbi:hypothetical protein SRHO_G00004530 [Serrasalmus rhombeus]
MVGVIQSHMESERSRVSSPEPSFSASAVPASAAHQTGTSNQGLVLMANRAGSLGHPCMKKAVSAFGCT